jgi:argininosuccinate lyase
LNEGNSCIQNLELFGLNYVLTFLPIPQICPDSYSFFFFSHIQGVPFRTSHDIAGKSVALCTSKNCQLLDLSLDELRSINPVFEKDVYEFLGVENAIQKFISYGSTGSACVADQLDYWIKKLEIK